MKAEQRSMPPPPRLVTEVSPLGEIVRTACGYQPVLDQLSAYDGTLERVKKNQRARFPKLALAAAVFVAGVVAVVAVFAGSSTHGRAPLARQVHEPPAQSMERALPRGESKLDDGTRVTVDADGSARVETNPKLARVALEHGTVTLDVVRQPSGRSCEVSARGYRFVVRGTSFSVSASDERVALDVREGRVAVFRGTTFLAELGPGESWSDGTADGTSAPPVPATPERKPVVSAPGPEPEPDRALQGSVPDERERDCLALARSGQARDAERCFVDEAAGSGLGAELALVELSRLRSDVLNDPNGALAALREHRRRFPNGSLRAEADISYLHLLSRVGNPRELLSESARVLETVKGRERSAELRMLRANTMRARMQDCAGAEREYAEVERSGGKFAAEARYYRGVCFEALGNPQAAAQAYRRYLDVPRRPHEAAARRRLRELEP
jgi:hypothetical protein